MEQLIVLIIAGFIALANWAVRKAAKTAEEQKRQAGPPPTAEPGARRRQGPVYEDEEERLRRFMEALGVPNPPVAPRPVATPLQPPVARRIRPPAPVTKAAAPPAPPRVVKPSPPPVVVAQPLAPEVDPSPYESFTRVPESPSSAFPAAPLEISAMPVEGSPGAGIVKVSELQSLLKSPSSLRTAILLREILGPPKSMQPPGFGL